MNLISSYGSGRRELPLQPGEPEERKHEREGAGGEVPAGPFPHDVHQGGGDHLQHPHTAEGHLPPRDRSDSNDDISNRQCVELHGYIPQSTYILRVQSCV